MPEMQQSIIEEHRAGGGHVLYQPLPAVQVLSGGNQVPAVRGNKPGIR